VGKPIPLKVTVTNSGDQILVDWTGSAAQVKGAINNTLSFTKSASYCAIRSVLPANIPNNEGVFRAIEVTAPPGTIGHRSVGFPRGPAHCNVGDGSSPRTRVCTAPLQDPNMLLSRIRLMVSRADNTGLVKDLRSGLPSLPRQGLGSDPVLARAGRPSTADAQP